MLYYLLMIDLVKDIIESFVGVCEQSNPQPNDLTWLDNKALMRKNATSAHIIATNQPQSLQDAYVLDVVGEISDKMQISPVKIMIYDAKDNKASAMHLSNNSLGISTAKIEQSIPQHLSATIAHEMGHQQQNAKSLAVSCGRATLEVSAGIAAALATYPTIKQSTNSYIAAGISTIVAVVAIMASSAVTEPLFSAFRREQELDADKNSAEINGATPMIEVLEQKIIAKNNGHVGEHIITEHKQKNWLQQLNAKHPSHEERIAALKQIEQSQTQQVRA